MGRRFRLHLPSSAVVVAVRLLPRAGRWRTGAFALLLVWSGLQGTALTVAIGVLLAALPEVARQGQFTPAYPRFLASLIALGGIFALGRGIEPFQAALTATLARRYQRLVQRVILDAASRPSGIGHLEDEQVANRLAIARGQAGGLPAQYVVNRLTQVVPAYLQAAASAALLSDFRWWAPLVVALGLIVERRWIDKELEAALAGMSAQAGEMRRAGYFRDLVLEAGAAKEMRVFGLGDWAIERYRAHWERAIAVVWQARKGHGRLALVALLGMTVAYAVVAMMIGLAGARGEIDVGQVAVFLGATASMAAVTWMRDPEWGLRTAAESVRNAAELDHLLGTAVQPVGSSADGLPHREIRFSGVHFRYPNSPHDVLNGLDLVIPVGTSLAIVGPNGVGKTTLIKLLARLYEPTSGRITVDGTDLADLDPVSWRRRLAVIFQDFARYELSARDNVAFGCPGLSDDPDAIARALQRAGAESTVNDLTDGLGTILSRRYRNGTDLSGGQWQRIALARCFLAVEGGASVLVLDEPTASLDVRAEAALFDRFLDLTQGLTTILITHRLATVRRADRIAVVEEGRVVEEGSPDELLARGGRYAALYALQAARFQSTETEEMTEVMGG